MAGGPKVVILATFCRFFHFPRGSIGNLSFSSRIPRHFFQKFMENDPFFGGGSPFGGGYPLIGGGYPLIGGGYPLWGGSKVCLLGSVENSGHFPLRNCVLLFV